MKNASDFHQDSSPKSSFPEECSQIEPLLSPYLDGELDSKRTALVFGHLHSCSQCKETLQIMENWKGAMQTLFQEAPRGAFLAKRVIQSVKREERKQAPQTFFSLHVAITICATLLLFALLSFWLYPPIHLPLEVRGKKIGYIASLDLFPNKIRLYRKQHWQKLKEQSLWEGDSIENLSSTPLQIVLKDGSQILLKPKSQIGFSRKKDSQIQLIHGKAYFSIRPQSSLLKIQAKETILEVLGTAFSVSIGEKWVTATLFQGKIRVFRQNHPQEDILLPGEEILVHQITPLAKKRRISLQDFQKRLNWITLPKPQPPHHLIGSDISKPKTVRRAQPPSPHRPSQKPRKIEKTDTPIQVKKYKQK